MKLTVSTSDYSIGAQLTLPKAPSYEAEGAIIKALKTPSGYVSLSPAD